MRGSEIEVGGNTRLFLGVYLCGGSIRVRGDAGDFAGAANQKGTIFIGGCTYLPGAEMTKGTITVQKKARILSSYQKTEIISIKGEGFQKYVGDMAEKGAGEVFVRVGSS